MTSVLDLDGTFAALADAHRRDILERVSAGPATASALAGALGMTVTGVLGHIRVLEGVGLAVSRKAGRTRWCELAPDALGPAEQWISSRRRLWAGRLDRFQQHVSSAAEPS